VPASGPICRWSCSRHPVFGCALPPLVWRFEAAGGTSSGRGSRLSILALLAAFLLLTASLNSNCSVSNGTSRCASLHCQSVLTAPCPRIGGVPPYRALRKLGVKPHTCGLYANNLPRGSRIGKRNVVSCGPPAAGPQRAEEAKIKPPGRVAGRGRLQGGGAGGVNLRGSGWNAAE